MSHTRWAPNTPRPGWEDTAPASRAKQLEDTAVTLGDEKLSLYLSYKILYDLVQEFLKDADKQNIGEDPGFEDVDGVSNDPLKVLQGWVWGWKHAFAEFDEVSDTGARVNALWLVYFHFLSPASELC